MEIKKLLSERQSIDNNLLLNFKLSISKQMESSSIVINRCLALQEEEKARKDEESFDRIQEILAHESGIEGLINMK